MSQNSSHGGFWIIFKSVKLCIFATFTKINLLRLEVTSVKQSFTQISLIWLRPNGVFQFRNI